MKRTNSFRRIAMSNKAKSMLSILLMLAFCGIAPLSRAELSLGISVGNEGIDSFYLNVGNYYQVPQASVLLCRDRHIPDEEIPVVLFLATRAHVAPELVIQQRLGGRAWMDIALG